MARASFLARSRPSCLPLRGSDRSISKGPAGEGGGEARCYLCHGDKRLQCPALEEFFEALERAYESALDGTVLDKFGGKYDAGEIRSLLDRADVLRMAFGKIQAR